jgi:hypothetical protein
MIGLSSKGYSLLFLGRPGFNGALSLQDSTDWWQQITIALHSCLNGLEGVDYSFRCNDPADLPSFYASLTRADGVLFWGIPQLWMRYSCKRLKQATGCRAVITIWEAPITKDSDWRFAFRDEESRTTRIDGPVWKELYNQSAKCPKTVMIDHWSQDTECDWTARIEAWLADFATEFHISRYVQYENDRQCPTLS